MRYKRLAGVVCILILIVGCQQSQIKTAESVHSAQRVSQRPPAEDSKVSSATQKKNSVLITASPLLDSDVPEIEPAPDVKTCDTPAPSNKPEKDSKETKEAKETGQDKIDQALELCTYAQKMWEKGHLDEALSSLDSAYYLILEIDHTHSHDLNQQKEDIRYLISKRILEIYASRQIVATGQHEEIPITLNQYVKKEINRLTGPERAFFIRSLERAGRYRPFIVDALKKAGLPQELSWLPLIESGFQLRVLSAARALGLWQFIPSTGHKFGLIRNYYIDERMDPEKSTLAAIAYFKELHKLFGDWTTALAAYNCGEYRVLQTIRRQKINYLDNFWDLYQNLPRETARYVPRFLATIHIVNNLEKYHIKIDNPLPPLEYQTFEIKKQICLRDIAKEINLPTQKLQMLNPELRHSLLPPETYPLKIPKEKAALFLSKLDKIKTTYSAPPRFVFHRVRKGDTLSGIARRYHTTIRAISRANHINRRHRIIVGKILKVPTRNQAGMANIAVSGRKSAQKLKKPARYRVRRGDNLWIIANRFSTTTKQIMVTNKLANTTLHIGQILYIAPVNSTISKQMRPGKQNYGTYRVKSGDSPFLIARKHKMSLNRLLALNHLNKRSKIFPGQKLIVE